MSKKSEYELPGAAEEYEISSEKPVQLLKKAALAAQAAAKAAAELGIAGYESDKTELASGYAAANRGAENAYNKAINPYGVNEQALRSGGLDDSGWAESSRVSLGNAYQNALSANRTDYLSELGRINLAIAAARQKGDVAALEAAGSYAVKIADMLYKQNRAAADDEQARLDYEYTLARDAEKDSRYAEELAYSREQAQKKDEYQKARDAVEDARYSSEWAYKTSGKQAAAEPVTPTKQQSGEPDGEKLTDLPPVGVGEQLSRPGLGVVSRLISRYFGAPTRVQVLEEIGRTDGLSAADKTLIMERFGYVPVAVRKM